MVLLRSAASSWFLWVSVWAVFVVVPMPPTVFHPTNGDTCAVVFVGSESVYHVVCQLLSVRCLVPFGSRVM